MVKKSTKTLATLALAGILGGCNPCSTCFEESGATGIMGTSPEVNMKYGHGTFVCNPKKGFEGPTYRFRSNDENTIFWLSPPEERGVTFYDPNSQKFVRIYEHSENNPYECDTRPLESRS